MKLGILPLARSTFDVQFAEERLTAMLAALDAPDRELAGPRALLLEPDAADAAMDDVLTVAPDLILVLQVTFTDAGFIARLAGATDLPIAIWAPPEPRIGGRLRLNALCRRSPRVPGEFLGGGSGCDPQHAQCGGGQGPLADTHPPHSPAGS